MCPSRRRIGYKMAKQSGTATTTNQEKQGTGEISYPVDDKKEECCTTMSQRGPRRKKETGNRHNRDEPHRWIQERNALKVRLSNPTPSQTGCV